MTTDGGYFFIFMFLFMIFKLVHSLYLHQNDASISISKYVKVLSLEYFSLNWKLRMLLLEERELNKEL